MGASRTESVTAGDRIEDHARVSPQRELSMADTDRGQVLKDLEDLKEHAKGYSVDDIRSGNWFYRFLRHVLENYTKKVNAAYFKQKYPQLPADAVIDRRVALAKRYSALEGGLTAGAYSAAIIATLGPAGAVSPITLPAAALPRASLTSTTDHS